MNYYYDYAASTPLSSNVVSEMSLWQNRNFSNPSSSHVGGEKAFLAINLAREVLADKIGVMPSEIIFTSGASEANNLAIKGLAFSHLRKKSHIITSAIEHKCILNTCIYLETLGFEVTYLQPDESGCISPNSLLSAIKSNTILISIHHVNNELGTIQPIHLFGKIALEHNIPFHTDAAQSFCKLKIDVDDMDVDLLSLSGHKIFGPKGIGALYVRSSVKEHLVPLIHGGGQEGGLRGGTLPTPLIVGLGAAVQSFPSSNDSVKQLQTTLSNYRYVRNGGRDVIPTIWNITFDSEQEKNRFFSAHNWLVSQGSACNAMSNAPSHVLSAIGFDEDKARRTYRISLPPYAID